MDFFVDHAVLFALICAGVAILYGLYLTWWLLSQPAGNERMREISRAVQEGAAAYLRKQYTTIAAVAIVPFLLIGFYNELGWGTAIGFLFGATLSAAAAYAQAARVFGALNTPAFNTYTAGLRTRAQDAWAWAVANPAVIFRNNDQAAGTAGLGAGQQEVDDAGRETKRLVAAVYLFALTGEATYRDYVDANYTRAPMFASFWLSPFSAGVTQPLLFYASLPGATPAVATAIKDRYVSLWDGADGWGAVATRRDPYGAFITDYTWGSSSVKALAGSMFVDQATYGLGTRAAAAKMDAGAAYLHYLHGVNPLGKVYLSNMGAYGAEDSVDQFYHSWFADGSALWDSVSGSTFGPPPGFVVGGPNPSYNWDDRCPGVSAACGGAVLSPPRGQPAQKSYLDFNTSWPLNSWSVTENSNGYQTNYIRLLARYVN